MTIPLGILASSGGKGIQSLNYLGTGSGTRTWTAAPLGVAAGNRYIAVVAGYRLGTSSTARFTGCAVGSIDLDLLHEDLNVNVSNQTRAIGIFGGYVPAGTSDDIVFTLSSAQASTTFDYSTYRLIGNKIEGLEAQSGSPFSPLLPKNAAILGVSESEAGGSAIAWTNMTRDVEKNNGNWRYSNASAFFADGGSVTVTCDSGLRGFVALG